jgi:hypothetical protein
MNQIELVLEMGQWIGDATVTNVRTDHVRVGQIITNLIANAIVSLGVPLCDNIAPTLNFQFSRNSPPRARFAGSPSSLT